MTDSMILLRYVEMYGVVKHGLTVLKMRGSAHGKDIHEFHMDGDGLHIDRPFRAVGGILSGRVVTLPSGDLPPFPPELQSVDPHTG